MSWLQFLLVRIAFGERLEKATRWDYRYGFGILLAFSLSVVFFSDWLRPLFDHDSSLRLWMVATLCILAMVGFAAFCGRYVPTVVLVVAVVTIWVIHFWLG